MAVVKIASRLAVTATLLSCLFLSGCGGSGSSVAPSGLTGVRADGSMASSGVTRHAGAVGTGSYALNPNYPNACLQPEGLSVALVKFELLKSEDDPSPYVVFSSTIDNPQVVNMTSGAGASFGENASYPTSGSYAYVRMTLAYYGIRITFDDGLGAGPQPGDFRLYASSVGFIKNGDVTVVMGGNQYWLAGDNYEGDHAPFQVTTDVGPRPDDIIGAGSICVHDFFFSGDDTVSPDPYVMTMALESPVVVPPHPSGQYRLAVNFDVTHSPEDPSATGMFEFDDVNGNGTFEPGTGQTGGAGRDFNDGVHGEPQFCILPPTITVSYSKVQ